MIEPVKTSIVEDFPLRIMKKGPFSVNRHGEESWKKEVYSKENPRVKRSGSVLRNSHVSRPGRRHPGNLREC